MYLQFNRISRIRKTVSYISIAEAIVNLFSQFYLFKSGDYWRIVCNGSCVAY